MKIQYFTEKNPLERGLYRWRVVYRNPKDEFKITDVTPFKLYPRKDAEAIAKLLNEAVDRHEELNEIPTGDSKRMLAVKHIDPNDWLESQKALDVLSTWLGVTERLVENMNGGLIDKKQACGLSTTCQ